MDAPRPPLEYLATCSTASLESIELARLGRAANLRKELYAVIEQWIEAEAEARTARAILEWRRLAGSQPAAATPGLLATPARPPSSSAAPSGTARLLRVGTCQEPAARSGVASPRATRSSKCSSLPAGAAQNRFLPTRRTACHLPKAAS